MALADGLVDSKYLIAYYVESAEALWAYEHDDNVEALGKAAGIICKALTQLSTDISFWDALAKLSGPTNGNQQIIDSLEELDLFLSQEEQVLLKYGLPKVIVKRLLYDLNLSLKNFRGNPDAQLLTQLRERVPNAASAICSVSQSWRKNAPEQKILEISLRTREGLAVLGGVVTIVVDGVSSIAHPIALLSIMGGAASSFGFLEWFRRKKG